MLKFHSQAVHGRVSPYRHLGTMDVKKNVFTFFYSCHLFYRFFILLNVFYFKKRALKIPSKAL